MIRAMFGPHLTLDLYGCDKDVIASEAAIFKILDEMPEIIGMHKISMPQIMPYDGGNNSFDKGGISAFVLIAESHITIHTFKEHEHAFVDIFSCKVFDIDKAVGYIYYNFKPQRVEKCLRMRGRHFSKDMRKTYGTITHQRAIIESPKGLKRNQQNARRI